MLNSAQLHLALNHFPIAGMFFVFLLLSVAFILKKKEMIFSGMIIAILSGVFIFALDFTGDGAEEMVENKAGVTKSLIHEHEEAAEKALILVVLTSLLAVGWMVADKFKKAWCSKLDKSVLVFSFVSLIFIANAAHLGGMIRHDELRPGASQAPSDD